MRRIVAGSAIFAACSLALSPAVGRVESVLGTRPSTVSLEALGSIGSFTPVTRDPRLARAYAQARAGVLSQGLRFTPSVGSMSGRRSITIVVRSADAGLASPVRTVQPSSTLGIGPVAYNLRAARGLAQFAVETGATREADPLVPVSALAVPRGFSIEKPKRFSPAVGPESQAFTGTVSQPVDGDRNFALDLGSSYALSRHFDVTAGVRYRARPNRLGPLTDDAQDSKAVYVGTTFKF